MDTIIFIRDSVTTCAKDLAEICQPCVKEAETNWQDVTIVFLICSTLLIIALNAICNYFKWKKYEKNASTDAAKEKRRNDVDDRQWKLNIDKESHELKRKEEQEDHDKKRIEEQKKQDDHDKKRKEGLEDKLHHYMESRIKEKDFNTEEDKYIEDLRKRIDAIRVDTDDKKE